MATGLRERASLRRRGLRCEEQVIDGMERTPLFQKNSKRLPFLGADLLAKVEPDRSVVQCYFCTRYAKNA
jgi:hypothetical protein